MGEIAGPRCTVQAMFELIATAMKPAMQAVQQGLAAKKMSFFAATQAAENSYQVPSKARSVIEAPVVPTWSADYVGKSYDGQDSGDNFNGNFSPYGNGDNVGAFSSWSGLGSGSIEMGGW